MFIQLGMNHQESRHQDLVLTLPVEGSPALGVEQVQQYDKDNPGQEVYSYWKSCHMIAPCTVLARVEIMRGETFQLISISSQQCVKLY